MTKEQLQELDHVTYRETPDFIHLHADEGFFITPYEEGEDIKEFSSSECYYLPIRDEYPDYHVIDEEENNRLIEEQRKAYEEDQPEEEINHDEDGVQ